MNKKSAFFVAFVLAVLMLAVGCSDQSWDDSNGPSPKPVTSTPTGTDTDTGTDTGIDTGAKTGTKPVAPPPRRDAIILSVAAPGATRGGAASKPSIGRGKSVPITVTRDSRSLSTEAVSWKVVNADGGSSVSTISEDGILTVGVSETAKKLKVTGTGLADKTKLDTVTLDISGSSAVVSGVSLSPASATVEKGNWTVFEATVEGSDNPSQAVTWSVSGGTDSYINKGVLTVGVNETSARLTVNAVSLADPYRFTKATVEITDPVIPLVVTGVKVNPNGAHMFQGDTLEFTAIVEGTGGTPSQEVEWTLRGGADSAISSNGVLTVGVNETASSLTVTVRSLQDTRVETTVTMTIREPIITGVTLYSSGTSVFRGETMQFWATVDGVGLPSQDVEWSVKGSMRVSPRNYTNPTSSIIHPTAGLLDVGEDEEFAYFQITAVSTGARSGTFNTTSALPIEVMLTTIVEEGLFRGTGDDRIKVPLVHGFSIQKAAAWIADNDDTYGTGKSYTIMVDSIRTEPAIGFDTSTGGIKIVVEGIKAAPTTIQLTGTGSLFSVTNGVTLVLDNVNAKGISTTAGNTASLVTVSNGGMLETRGSTSISGNTVKVRKSGSATSSPVYGGGVFVDVGGKFDMYDTSSVHSNRITHEIVTETKFWYDSDRSERDKKATKIPDYEAPATYAELYGGGVAVYGALRMFNTSAIRGNIIEGRLKCWGGGVYVGGEFTMEDNSIVENNRVIGSGQYVFLGWNIAQLIHVKNKVGDDEGIRYEWMPMYQQLGYFPKKHMMTDRDEKDGSGWYSDEEIKAIETLDFTPDTGGGGVAIAVTGSFMGAFQVIDPTVKPNVKNNKVEAATSTAYEVPWPWKGDGDGGDKRLEEGWRSLYKYENEVDLKNNGGYLYTRDVYEAKGNNIWYSGDRDASVTKKIPYGATKKWDIGIGAPVYIGWYD